MMQRHIPEQRNPPVANRGGGGSNPPPPEIPKFWQSRTGIQIERKMFKCSYSNILISFKIAEFRTTTPLGSQLFYISNDK
jgi:hypothetical protein